MHIACGLDARASTSHLHCCRLREITGLASRASQACFLVSLLISRQLPRLTILLEETWRKKLAGFTLKDVVCSKDGEDTMTQLISVLLDEHQAAPGRTFT